MIPFTASAQQSLIVDSAGNVGIGTSAPASSVHLTRGNNTSKLLIEETAASTVQRLFEVTHNGFPTFNFRNSSTGNNWDFRLSGRNGDAFEITKVGTGTAEFYIDQNGDATLIGTLTVGGIVDTSSSRTVKEQIMEVDPSQVLAAVADMPIVSWKYIRDKAPVRHMGPVAEDFHGAFGLGKDNKHIAPTDLAGVALAAIQGLKAEQDRMMKEKEAEIAALMKAQAEQKLNSSH